MQTAAIPVNELVTTSEAARALRVGRGKIASLIADGRLKAVRLGRRTVRIKADSLGKLLSE